MTHLLHQYMDRLREDISRRGTLLTSLRALIKDHEERLQVSEKRLEILSAQIAASGPPAAAPAPASGPPPVSVSSEAAQIAQRLVASGARGEVLAQALSQLPPEQRDQVSETNSLHPPAAPRVLGACLACRDVAPWLCRVRRSTEQGCGRGAAAAGESGGDAAVQGAGKRRRGGRGVGHGGRRRGICAVARDASSQAVRCRPVTLEGEQPQRR